MAQFKRLWPLIQLFFSVVGFVGCASVVTLPATSLPFVALGVILLFLSNVPSVLDVVWRVLQVTVIFQSAVFAVSIAYTYLTEWIDVLSGSFHVTTRFEPDMSEQERRRLRYQGEVRHLIIGVVTVLLALLPVSLLLLGWYFWRSGREILGVSLEVVGVLIQLVFLYVWYWIVSTKPSPHRRF